jgi:hypothetical protein
MNALSRDTSLISNFRRRPRASKKSKYLFLCRAFERSFYWRNRLRPGHWNAFKQINTISHPLNYAAFKQPLDCIIERNPFTVRARHLQKMLSAHWSPAC